MFIKTIETQNKYLFIITFYYCFLYEQLNTFTLFFFYCFLYLPEQSFVGAVSQSSYFYPIRTLFYWLHLVNPFMRIHQSWVSHLIVELLNFSGVGEREVTTNLVMFSVEGTAAPIVPSGYATVYTINFVFYK